MFTFQETYWQLVRNKGRTIILLLSAAILAGCMAFYLGNIQVNEEALTRLALSSKVEVVVSNATGESTAGLNIDPIRCENFWNCSYLCDVRYNVIAVGAYSKDARAEQVFTGGDVNVMGLNCEEAVWMPDGEFSYADGYDKSFLMGDKSQCLVDRQFAEKNSIFLGDQVSLPIYLMRFQQGGEIDYIPLGELTMDVVGYSSSNITQQAFIVPVNWLRKVAESENIRFTYSTCYGYMKDPRQLNRFKAQIESMAFLKPNPEAQDQYSGTAIVVEDENYIISAEEIGKNIANFRQFLIPFFMLIIGLVMLEIFLIMRGSQRDMAIACSMGRPKFLIALANFLTAFVTEIVGCLLVLPVILLFANLSPRSGLLICGAFLLCACVGNCIGLALTLRFDALNLLTAVE